MDSKEPLEFGVDISIYYFHRDDFEKIMNNLQIIIKNKKEIDFEEKRIKINNLQKI